ncbi:endonuclease exonuclease phosphatase domain containing protein [Elysia marginata]|uniref:Endonuclease exonuclease phosphatase domain containing protein n=1 Tax=Elysia marginata TaxID=1093978 RepID=A0AAV4H0U2_9GAST|nr:endonuclease exonuclease phosphatase domain containing protein [Elysia marginata]
MNLLMLRKTFRLKTWNVRTLHQTGKLKKVARKFNAFKLDTLGITKTRWTANIEPAEVDLEIDLEPPNTKKIPGAIKKTDKQQGGRTRWNTGGFHKRKCGALSNDSDWTVPENMGNGGISSRIERRTHCQTPRERESPGVRKLQGNNPVAFARESV